MFVVNLGIAHYPVILPYIAAVFVTPAVRPDTTLGGRSSSAPFLCIVLVTPLQILIFVL